MTAASVADRESRPTARASAAMPASSATWQSSSRIVAACQMLRPVTSTMTAVAACSPGYRADDRDDLGMLEELAARDDVVGSAPVRVLIVVNRRARIAQQLGRVRGERDDEEQRGPRGGTCPAPGDHRDQRDFHDGQAGPEPDELRLVAHRCLGDEVGLHDGRHARRRAGGDREGQGPSWLRGVPRGPASRVERLRTRFDDHAGSSWRTRRLRPCRLQLAACRATAAYKSRVWSATSLHEGSHACPARGPALGERGVERDGEVRRVPRVHVADRRGGARQPADLAVRGDTGRDNPGSGGQAVRHHEAERLVIAR